MPLFSRWRHCSFARHGEAEAQWRVIHGRNGQATKAMFAFLRAIDLRPMEWTELVGEANLGAPYIGDVLDAAFERAQAVVVLSTPDDLSRLRADLIPEGDPEREAEIRGQARPNVFIEAGMALGRFPNRTILTELGRLRLASDLLGRHTVRLHQGPECRQDLALRLENAR
jgi:predicted nucleotide-binding protein